MLMLGPLMTVDETRRYLGGERPISKDVLYRLIRDGAIESILLGPRSRRIKRESVDNYIKKLSNGEAE